jgi:hypothetical protein
LPPLLRKPAIIFAFFLVVTNLLLIFAPDKYKLEV